MPREKQPKQESDILDNLFGDPSELADDELDLLFTTLTPGIEPAANMRAIAESAAVKYRVQNKVPPDHVRVVLDSTSEIRSLDSLTTSKLSDIVNSIGVPFTGAVFDPACAYRNRDGELDDRDQAIVDALADELEKDWDKEGN